MLYNLEELVLSLFFEITDSFDCDYFEDSLSFPNYIDF